MSELHPNDALVDYAGILKTISDLQNDFTLLNFLDYCVLVEGIVLHNSLIMVGATQTAKTEEAPTVVRIRNELAPWNDSGALAFEEQSPAIQKIRKLTPELVTGSEKTVEGRALPLMLEQAWFETGRIVAAERVHKRPALPLLRQAPYYERDALVRKTMRCVT